MSIDETKLQQLAEFISKQTGEPCEASDILHVREVKPGPRLKEEIRSEDAAEQVSVTGWACKKCKRFWGEDEHMARYCCSTTFPCECGKRYGKNRCRCEECQQKQDHEKWYAKPEIEWNGEYPIAIWNCDQYFFNEDDLMDYLVALHPDHESDENDVDYLTVLDSLWLTTCEPNNGRDFCMSEYLCDDLAEDDSLDDKEINKTVNDWIEKHAPFSFGMTGNRLSIPSVKLRLR